MESEAERIGIKSKNSVAKQSMDGRKKKCIFSEYQAKFRLEICEIM